MASPIGHSIFALGVARADAEGATTNGRWWFALALIAVNAPDIDFLPGLLIGDINRYHRSVTHSLLASLIFATAMMVVTRPWRMPALRVGLVSGGLYLSHVLFDLLSGNPIEPSGQPLLWPFSTGEVLSPWSPLLGVEHGGQGAGFWQFLDAIFSWRNVQATAMEILVFVPLALLAKWVIRTLRSDPRPPAGNDRR